MVETMENKVCELYVNGKSISVNPERKLIDILRNELRLKSVKDGCSEGACGTCTVLIDGRAMKCCVQKAARLAGKHIMTVEGLSKREQDVYAYAFGRAGAVQCGFCIPGMVICAKALLDVKPNPSRLEIVNAIRNNYCRCTGYKKIIDAIELAAKIFRENLSLGEAKAADSSLKVGRAACRIDAAEKVLGTGRYTDDLDGADFPGMIYGSAVRSAYPRAIVKSIDTSEAESLPGVLCVLTAADVPGSNIVGHLKQDWDTMIPIGGITHYLGDAICLVAAESKEILERAKALVKVEYEELPAVTCPAEALAENAPLVHPEAEHGNLLSHEHLIRGNADEVIAHSAYKVTQHYETPWTEHAFLEPECAVAIPFGGGVYIYSSDQSVYDTQREVSTMLGLATEKVIVEDMLVGGGFGGKEDVTVQHHAALIAYITKRPVKVKLSRAESLLIHPKRHPMSIDLTTACDERGFLTAMKAVIVSDTGAYASLGGPVLQRACTHAAGPYNYQVIDIEGKAAYTNNPPAGAFRGFGVTQSCFATERNIDLLAEKAGIDAWQFRWQNAIKPGQVLPNGQIADPSTGLTETLAAVKDVYYGAKAGRVGIACAMKNAGVGIGLPDVGRVRLAVKGGRIHIYTGASCLGQGLGTVMAGIVADTLHVSSDNIIFHRPNTASSPDSGTSSGSRQTLVTGEAARRAAQKMRRALFAACGIPYKASQRHSSSLPEVVITEEDEQTRRISFSADDIARLNNREFCGEYLAKTDAMGAAVKYPRSHVAYGYATQLCLLNDDGTIDKIVAAHDVGRAINPRNVEGQIEGGVIMGCGYALTEQYPLDHCAPKAKFGTLGLFRADKAPDVESVIVEKGGVDVACGAIGIGEITCIPTAPAIANAYYKFSGIMETSLPLVHTPYARKMKIVKKQ